jgi:hypothetical protein
MSSTGLIVSIVMLLGGLAWLGLPYLRGNRTALGVQRETLRERPTLAARYERALLSVRELDEDYSVGKLSPEAYATERARWVEEGAALLEALEKTSGAPDRKARKAARHETPPPIADADDPVEQAIAAYMHAREGSRSK